jgi:3-dehydroquinate dehydratase
MKDILEDTVEYLDEELQSALAKIDNIAAMVYEKKMDSYEGFLETEKYNKIIVEIGNKLKEKGIDITKIAEYQQL